VVFSASVVIYVETPNAADVFYREL